jgi:hypothetical protein
MEGRNRGRQYKGIQCSVVAVWLSVQVAVTVLISHGPSSTSPASR